MKQIQNLEIGVILVSRSPLALPDKCIVAHLHSEGSGQPAIAVFSDMMVTQTLAHECSTSCMWWGVCMGEERLCILCVL